MRHTFLLVGNIFPHIQRNGKKSESVAVIGSIVCVTLFILLAKLFLDGHAVGM